MGVKNAELYIKVKGGHFEHIMKIKPTIIVNINCFQSIFSKNYYYHSKNLIHSAHEPLQKSHFQMGHPVEGHYRTSSPMPNQIPNSIPYPRNTA